MDETKTEAVVQAFDLALDGCDAELIQSAIRSGDESLLQPVYERLESVLGASTIDRLADFLAAPNNWLGPRLQRLLPIPSEDWSDAVADSLTLPDGVEQEERFESLFQRGTTPENQAKIRAINGYRNERAQALLNRHHTMVELALQYARRHDSDYLVQQIKSRLVAMLNNNFEAAESGLGNDRSRYAQSYRAPGPLDCLKLLLDKLDNAQSRDFLLDVFSGKYLKTLDVESHGRTDRLHSYDCLFGSEADRCFDSIGEHLHARGALSDEFFIQVARQWPRCLKGYRLYREPADDETAYQRAYRRHLYAVAADLASDLSSYCDQFERIFSSRNFKGVRWVGMALAHMSAHGLSHDALLAKHPARLQSLPASLHTLLGITALAEGDTESTINDVLGGYSREELIAVVFYTGAAKESVMKLCGWQTLIALDRYIAELAQLSSLRANDVVSVAKVAERVEGCDTALLDDYLLRYRGSHEAPVDVIELVRAALNLDRPKVEKRLLRHAQNAIMAYGLYAVENAAELRDRYLRFMSMHREAQKYGSERQENTQRAVAIGLHYLARGAGFTDVDRMAWKLEAELSDNAATLHQWQAVGDWRVRLQIDGTDAVIAVERAGKLLKSVPAKVRQSDVYKAMRASQEQVRDQARRYAKTLQRIMALGEELGAEDLAHIARLPVVDSMLSQLIVRSESGCLGFYQSADHAIVDLNGAASPAGSVLKIAHPFDLYKAGLLAGWHKKIFGDRVVQPFKQAYRELYLLTAVEKSAPYESRRFAGQVVYADMAARLLQRRDWSLSAGDVEGDAYAIKTYAAEDLTVFVEFPLVRYTFLNEPTTIGSVSFQRQSKPVALAHIDPVLFSEVMRDVDLVAAVAQTDESATATSQIVAARSSLVAQWVDEMGLRNVTCEKNRARVVGKLGEYSVNLASGVVFKYPLPSRYVCIVPGRRLARDEVYLPFADSGAKEREIISKILLLCNDDKIEDELILEQIADGGD